MYVDKIDVFEPSPFLDFGTAVHEGCETLLETNTVDKEKLLNDIVTAWEKHGFDQPDWVEKQPGWYNITPYKSGANGLLTCGMMFPDF